MNFRMMAAGAALGVMMWSSASLAADPKADKTIDTAVSGNWRSADSKARDHERHPAQALAFWGLKPGMSILELQPGGGWWTEILAPYARQTKGEFAATAADLDDPDLSENARKGRADFAAKYADEAVYGKVNLGNWGSKAKPLPANKYDFVLAARVFRFDLYLCGISSLAGIGGVASAPVLAATYTPILVPIAVLLAMLGLILGTGIGLFMAQVLRALAP